MKELSSAKCIVKRSRFFAHLYEIECETDLNEILKFHRKEYKKANHHCYALQVNLVEPAASFKSFKDDGEVGHPGRVLLELLRKYDLEKHALVVSRMFGGIKLGVGSVSRAFRDLGEYVIKCHLKNRKS